MSRVHAFFSLRLLRIQRKAKETTLTSFIHSLIKMLPSKAQVIIISPDTKTHHMTQAHRGENIPPHGFSVTKRARAVSQHQEPSNEEPNPLCFRTPSSPPGVPHKYCSSALTPTRMRLFARRRRSLEPKLWTCSRS